MKEILTDILIKIMKEKKINNYAFKYIDKDNFTYVNHGEIKNVICGFDIFGFEEVDQVIDVKSSIRNWIEEQSKSNLDFEHIKVMDYSLTYEVLSGIEPMPVKIMILFVYE